MEPNNGNEKSLTPKQSAAPMEQEAIMTTARLCQRCGPRVVAPSEPMPWWMPLLRRLSVIPPYQPGAGTETCKTVSNEPASPTRLFFVQNPRDSPDSVGMQGIPLSSRAERRM